MDISSELEVYQLLQLVNNQNSSDDNGTILFVRHLFKVNKLRYIRALYGREITLYQNEDLPYLIELENLLEHFGEEYDRFIRKDSGRALSNSRISDVETAAENLLKEISEMSRIRVNESNIEGDLRNFKARLDNAIRHLKKLCEPETASGIRTNMSTALELIESFPNLNTNGITGKYFYYFINE